jgi:hypothetical protein
MCDAASASQRLARALPCLRHHARCPASAASRHASALIRRKRETNESKGYRLPEEIKEGREENKERGKRKKEIYYLFFEIMILKIYN